MKQFILGLFFLLLSAIFYSANVIANAVGTDSAYLVIILSVVSLVFGIFFLAVSAKNEN